MNKTELISFVAEAAELTKKDASKAVDAVFDAIEQTLKTGDKVQPHRFWKFRGS